ncbi:hypothetical protein NKH18_06895 [Streptomyces sp. M10(2022)]
MKAYIALHNAYGIDLNDMGVELAEVSLWLNTMHPGMRAPWFGLHLRRGNSLIGARRWVYEATRIKGSGPSARRSRPSCRSGRPGTAPSSRCRTGCAPVSPADARVGRGCGASGDAKKLVEQLARPQVDQLRAWKKGIQTKPKKTGGKASQLARLQAAARRVEFLWKLVAKRMELSEQEIARTIDVWGPTARRTRRSTPSSATTSGARVRVCR